MKNNLSNKSFTWYKYFIILSVIRLVLISTSFWFIVSSSSIWSNETWEQDVMFYSMVTLLPWLFIIITLFALHHSIAFLLTNKPLRIPTSWFLFPLILLFLLNNMLTVPLSDILSENDLPINSTLEYKWFLYGLIVSIPINMFQNTITWSEYKVLKKNLKSTPKPTSQPDYSVSSLIQFSKKELRGIAAKLSISGYEKMNKKQLIEVITLWYKGTKE